MAWPPASTSLGTPEQDIEEEEGEDAQSSYYNLLRHRFVLLRSTLRCSPPASAIGALDDSHPISLPYSLKPARSEWRRLLLTTDPQMVQLACMDMDSVFGVLKIVARLLSESVKSGDAARIRRIGAWTWGLLGRCRDVGQLTSEEVSELRELGKRAVKILTKLKEERANKALIERYHGNCQQEGEMVDSDQDDDGAIVETGEVDADAYSIAELPVDNDNVPPEVDQQPSTETTTTKLALAEPAASEEEDTDLAAAKARLQARLLLQVSQTGDDLSTQKETSASSINKEDEEEADEENIELKSDFDDSAKKTHAMLDMIITVVGEFYGQRDLLDAREVWE